MITFTAGRYECQLIVDGSGTLPAEIALDGVAADVRDAALRDRLDEQGRVHIPYSCLLIRGADATVLVDTGIGAYDHPLGGRGGALESELGAVGLSPEDIPLVVVTHGHVDHIGGLCRDGRPRFASARHVLSRIEWEWWQANDDAPVAHEQLRPLEGADLLDRVEGASEVLPGIRVLPAPGHTPGQLAVEIDGPDGALYLADVVVDELAIEHPDWGMAFDDDPATAAATRRALLERASAERLLVAAAHLPAPGRVERHGDGLRFVA